MPSLVINTGDLDRFIAERAGLLDVAGQAWAARHLRRFLLRDGRSHHPVRGNFVGRELRDNLRRARHLGLDPVWFRIDPRVEDEIGCVLDWVGALPQMDPRLAGKLKRISYEDARVQADDWHARLAQGREATLGEEADSCDTEIELDGGWRWVRLTSAAALDYEGRRMRHCIGDGAYDRFRTEIFSLRDAHNEPHVTLEFDPGRERIQQARGRANNDVPGKYLDTVEVLLRRLRPKRLHTRLTEFAIAEDGDILRVSRAADWPAGTRLLRHLVLSNRDDVTALPDGLHVNGSMLLNNCRLERLPRDLTVCHSLAGLALSPISELPEGLVVRVLNLEDSLVKTIAPGTRVLRELYLLHSQVRELPPGLSVGELMIFDGREITTLPPDLTVGGRVIGEIMPDLESRGVPPTIVVIGDVNFPDLLFEYLDAVTIYGRLEYAGWTNPGFPRRLEVHGDFDLSEAHLSAQCAEAEVIVHGDLDLRGASLPGLPVTWTVHGRIERD